MDADALHARLLSEGPDSPMLGLARLAVDAFLATPLTKLTTPERLAGWGQDALGGWAESPDAARALEQLAEEAVRALRAEPRSLGELTPRELKAAVLELAGRPFSPDKALVMKLIDQKPLRDRIREMVIETVTEFTTRAPGAGMAKGLTGLAKFAAGQARARTGGLGALVGAVTDEVSGQLEKRAREFADAALAGVLAEIADIVSNPARAGQAAEIRVAVVRGAFDLTHPQLGRELLNLDVPGGGEVLRGAVKRWLASEGARGELLALAQVLYAPPAVKTVGDVMRQLGQEAALRAHFEPWLAERFRDLVAQSGFAEWLRAVCG